MPSFIARQPNGRLCRWSTVCDNFTHINMTDEDYIEICAEQAAERAREDARDALKRFVKPFDFILDHREDITAQYRCDLESEGLFDITDEERKELKDKIQELEAEFDQNIKLMTEPADHWQLN